MNPDWRDAVPGALSWGFWLGLIVAIVVLTLASILAGAAAGPEAAARIDRVALWERTAIGFGAGFCAGAFAHLYLHGLEKKAETHRR